MKAKFHLTVEPGLTGFKLRKPGQGVEHPFPSIPQAMRYAHAVSSGPAELIIFTSDGKEIGHVKV